MMSCIFGMMRTGSDRQETEIHGACKNTMGLFFPFVSSLQKSAHLVLFAASLAYYLLFFNYGLEVDDEGYLLLGAAEVLRGKWPLADFTSYNPLSYWLLAGVFKIFGQGVLQERLMLLLFLLANGQMVLWLALRFLPLSWALAVAGLYAFAPGPWYKLFFIFSILIIATASLFYLEKPCLKRAALLGLSVGVGFLFRKEAGILGLMTMIGVLALPFMKKWLEEKKANMETPKHLLIGLVFAFVPVAIAISVYSLAGKLEKLADYFGRFSLGADTKTILAKMGVLTPFNPAAAFSDIEQAFYAIGLCTSAVFTLQALRDFFTFSSRREEAAKKTAFGVFALASMSYSFPFVWSTRMLSTFPLVYVCYAAVLEKIVKKIDNAKLRKITAAFGLAALLIPVLLFTKHQIYSGSITTRLERTVKVDHPLLRGVYPYQINQRDIERLSEEMAKAPENASLVSMSESTTMGFLSGLSNPTVYRAFSIEFARPDEEEKAIEIFEQLKIDYFVGRKRQFMEEGGPASNLDAYAPKIKKYILDNYNMIPLGNNFVLFQRKQ